MAFLKKKTIFVTMVLTCPPSPPFLGFVMFAKLASVALTVYVGPVDMSCAALTFLMMHNSIVSCAQPREVSSNRLSMAGITRAVHACFPLPFTRWVHVVCMLYTPNMEYMEPSLLSGVTLDQFPSSRWGSKSCQLCEDVRMSKTGICIGCDAGLCKSSFHVTW